MTLKYITKKYNYIPYIIIGRIVIESIITILNYNNNIKFGTTYELERYLIDDENILYYYNDQTIYIILTNKRFIKIENKIIVSKAYLENILYINHIDNRNNKKK